MAIQKLKRPNGEIYYSVYVQCWNVHGKRIQKRKQGFKSLRQAQEAENRLRAEFLVEKGKPQRIIGKGDRIFKFEKAISAY